MAAVIMAEPALQVPTEHLESLCLRWVYFGHSAPGICRGMRQSEVSQLFNRGFVCVRAWDRVTGEPCDWSDRAALLSIAKAFVTH